MLYIREVLEAASTTSTSCVRLPMANISFPVWRMLLLGHSCCSVNTVRCVYWAQLSRVAGFSYTTEVLATSSCDQQEGMANGREKPCTAARQVAGAGQDKTRVHEQCGQD